MLRPTLLFTAATLVAASLVVSACHDEPKPASVPLPTTSASGVDSVAAAPPPAPAKAAELVIEDHRVVVHGAALLEIPDDQSHGFDAKYKRSGPNDLYLPPLAAAFARDAGAWAPSLTVDVADRTSYRILLEVLFTLGQSEISQWALRRLGHAEELVIVAPRFNAGSGLPGATALNAVVLRTSLGVSVKAKGGNVAPGCQGVGPGVAFPQSASGDVDRPALAACLRQLKSQVPERMATYTANPDIPFYETWSLLTLMRGTEGDLFLELQLGISR